MKQSELDDAVEQLIDRSDLDAVLCAIVNVCMGEGDHLRTNWRDVATAKWWEKCGDLVAKACGPRYPFPRS